MRRIKEYLYTQTIPNKNWKEGDSIYKKTKTITIPNPKMKIRILSDIHADFNKNYPLELQDKEIFTLLAGDISGYPEIGINWIKENIKNGLYVEGNHIFYNNLKKPLQELYQMYQEEFPLNSDVSFLQNQYKIINDIVFIGCTLWTDCRLNGGKDTEELSNTMNDYIYGKYIYNEGTESECIERFTPAVSIEEFNKSIKYISKICDEHKGKKVVVLTHHCPSNKCISPYYRSNDCNQAYASNLEDFIKNHGNIVLWVCGHSHSQCDFKIDGCRVIMNCRGYVSRGEDEKFNPNKTVLI